MGINRILTKSTSIRSSPTMTIIVVKYNLAERPPVGQVDLWTRLSDEGSR